MKNLTFKQCYAIIALIVFIIYGWIYLMEHRYILMNDSGTMFDTWKWEYVSGEKFLPSK